MCEVVADEYGCTVSETSIPIFTQSGDDRYNNADKMIIKGAQVLPHALINNVEEKLGLQGESWPITWPGSGSGCLPNGWTPQLHACVHIDVYGTIGALYGNNNYAAMADYLAKLEELAKTPAPSYRRPHGLRL